MPNHTPSPTTNPDAPPNRNMAYCRTCGAQIAKKAKVCPHCGAKNKTPFYKKWWFWSIVVIVVIGAFGSSGDKESARSPASAPSSPQSEAPSVPESSSASEPSSTPESASLPESSSAESSSNAFMPGDTVEAGGLRITYQECDADWRGYSAYLGPQSGNKVVRGYFIFENISKSDQSCGSFNFSCYADGVACSQFIWSDDELSLTTISPGRKAQGYASFEVPIDAEEIELEYEDSFNFFSNKKLIFMVE